MKSDYKERARRFLEELFPYISNTVVDPWIIENKVEEYCEEHHRRVNVCYGVSRIALITSDYVIKMDMSDGADWAGDCEHEFEKYEQIKQTSFAYLFAEITKVEIEGRVFYIMSRIKGVRRHNYYDITWQVERNFIEEYTCDTHCGNYGYQDGHIVMIDYAMDA